MFDASTVAPGAGPAPGAPGGSEAVVKTRRQFARELDEFFGFDSADDLVAARDLMGLLRNPRYRAWHAFRDSPEAAYVALVAIGIGGVAIEIIGLLGDLGSYSLGPLDAPGLWLATIGMAIALWGARELLAERPSTT